MLIRNDGSWRGLLDLKVIAAMCATLARMVAADTDVAAPAPSAGPAQGSDDMLGTGLRAGFRGRHKGES